MQLQPVDHDDKTPHGKFFSRSINLQCKISAPTSPNGFGVINFDKRTIYKSLQCASEVHRHNAWWLREKKKRALQKRFKRGYLFPFRFNGRPRMRTIGEQARSGPSPHPRPAELFVQRVKADFEPWRLLSRWPLTLADSPPCFVRRAPTYPPLPSTPIIAQVANKKRLSRVPPGGRCARPSFEGTKSTESSALYSLGQCLDRSL